MKKDKIKKLIESLEKPIPEDPKVIESRYAWLSLSCLSASRKTLKLFSKYFNTYFNIKIDDKDNEKLWFEISILMLSTALINLEKRLKNVLQKKKEKEVEEINRDCIIKAILIFSYFFSKKTVEDIFDVYASYDILSLKILNEEKKGSAMKNLKTKIRNFHKIEKKVYNKETHFAKRVRNIIKDIELEELALFAKKHISIQGTLLSLDAFSVDQKEVLKALKEFAFFVEEN
jgi:hypothetical protein